MKTHTTFRLTKSDKELQEFLESKGGLKPGVRFLYQFYLNNQNLVDEIVSRLSGTITNTTLKAKPIELKSGFNFDSVDTNKF